LFSKDKRKPKCIKNIQSLKTKMASQYSTSLEDRNLKIKIKGHLKMKMLRLFSGFNILWFQISHKDFLLCFEKKGNSFKRKRMKELLDFTFNFMKI